jgi:hypothetical protein
VKNAKNKEMKINLNISEFKRLLIGFTIIVISIGALAQNGETTSLKKAIKVGESPDIELNLYDLSAEVMPSVSNEVRIELDYIAEGKEEELMRLKDLIESYILTGSSGSTNVTIDLAFQNSFDLEIMGMKLSKVTFKSQKKESIKLKEFKIIRCEIWLPATANITLDAKYSQVNFENSIKGNFDLDLYDGQLHLQDVSGYLRGDAKYSKVKAGNLKDVDLELYETELLIGNSIVFDMDAKYSTIKIGEAKSVRLGIYEGGFSCLKTETAQIKNKYASIKFNELEEIQLNAYEGSFEANEVKTMSMEAKYLGLSLGQVDDFRMYEGYENEISFDKVNTLVSKDGKYNEFTIGNLGQSLVLSAYEDEIEIESVAQDFQKIELAGKYVEADFNLVNPSAYVLKGNVQYPDLDISENQYKIRTKIGDSSRLEFLYEYGNVNESSSVISIEGYEMEVSIQH